MLSIFSSGAKTPPNPTLDSPVDDDDAEGPRPTDPAAPPLPAEAAGEDDPGEELELHVANPVKCFVQIIKLPFPSSLILHSPPAGKVFGSAGHIVVISVTAVGE